MNYRWYVLATALFVACGLGGAMLIAISGDGMMWMLGSLIAASSIAGALVSLWAFHFDDPWQFGLYRFRIAMFLRGVGDALQVRTRRRSYYRG